MLAGAFHVGLTTTCQCMKPLLHPEQATKIGNQLGKKGSDFFRVQKWCSFCLQGSPPGLSSLNKVKTVLQSLNSVRIFQVGNEEFPDATAEESLASA